MKTYLLLLGIIFSANLFAQIGEVKFREETFDNGMTYPQVITESAPEVESSINANILEQLKDIEASDFCIGQFGYVQKGMHLQIHIFCNCIDFDESENRFFLYNLESGAAVPYSDLLGAKRKEATGNFLVEKVREYLGENQSELSEEMYTEIGTKNLDAFKVEMTKAGLNISLPDFPKWGEKPLLITWGELRSFLRVNYI
ncbi:MAG: hypothetical protein QNK23_17990 [Crocinitomicaceae bacterium]|nr:hypothetical protein [Crocinitomicaceae bacterium]